MSDDLPKKYTIPSPETLRRLLSPENFGVLEALMQMAAFGERGDPTHNLTQRISVEFDKEGEERQKARIRAAEALLEKRIREEDEQEEGLFSVSDDTSMATIDPTKLEMFFDAAEQQRRDEGEVQFKEIELQNFRDQLALDKEGQGDAMGGERIPYDSDLARELGRIIESEEKVASARKSLKALALADMLNEDMLYIQVGEGEFQQLTIEDLQKQVGRSIDGRFYAEGGRPLIDALFSEGENELRRQFDPQGLKKATIEELLSVVDEVEKFFAEHDLGVSPQQARAMLEEGGAPEQVSAPGALEPGEEVREMDPDEYEVEKPKGPTDHAKRDDEEQGRSGR